jgi:hypothetical protein
MLATVQLDDQAFFEADEIDNVFSERKLTADLQDFKGAAAKPVARDVPPLRSESVEIAASDPDRESTAAPSPLAPLPQGERGTRVLAIASLRQ